MVLMRWLKWESLPWHLNRKSIFFKIFSRRLTYIGKLNIKVVSTYSSCNPEMKNQINKDYNDKKHASMKYWPKPRQLNWMNQQFFFPSKISASPRTKSISIRQTRRELLRERYYYIYNFTFPMFIPLWAQKPISISLLAYEVQFPSLALKVLRRRWFRAQIVWAGIRSIPCNFK